ncbi:MAG: penicillin-insensitive murein endopeptidase [Solirubrobacterales bacterium]
MSESRRARRRGACLVAVVVVAGAIAAVAGAMLGADEPGSAAERAADVPRTALADAERSRTRRDERDPPDPRIEWRESRAVGLPHAGTLEGGVKLPFGGPNYFTWDPIQKESPNRGWRRWGTDGLVRTTLRVVREFAAAHPRAPRIGIGDLSRPRGGDFGPRYGLPGHASHQSGLDADLYYPRLDRRERAPLGAGQIDRELTQDLVDRFVGAGAETVFVGPSTGLGGPPGVVVPLVNHDNHLHVRMPG